MPPFPGSPDSSDPFAGFELIASYSRSDALREGTLHDLSDLAQQSGFVVPVAATAAVFHNYLDPSADLIAEGQSLVGRAHDLLFVLRIAIAASPSTDTLFFKVLFVLAPGRPAVPVPLKALIGPGDSGEPVLTILEPDED